MHAALAAIELKIDEAKRRHNAFLEELELAPLALGSEALAILPTQGSGCRTDAASRVAGTSKDVTESIDLLLLLAESTRITSPASAALGIVLPMGDARRGCSELSIHAVR